MHQKRRPLFMHLSVDDVIWPLEEITIHKNQYSSIYDQPDFAALKKIHDQYGAVFTLNLFQYNNVNADASTFNLSMMTDRFKKEFKSAKNWLKFAYHSKFTITRSEELPYEVLEDSIKRVYDDIERFACPESVDRIPRFGFFSVSKECLIRLKRAGYINGCLTADDDRESNCGLMGDELLTVQRCDMYTDYNNIMYFRSEHRFDNLNSVEILALLNQLNGDENNNKCFILFGHTVDKDKIQLICDWAAVHHIPFGYPLEQF